MNHETDASDAKSLAAGEIEVLLARYDDAIRDRCVAKLKGHADADDVAQNVRLRLFAEFHRGKTYGATPYRVVVHKVIGWTVGDYYGSRPLDVPLPENWSPEDTHPTQEQFVSDDYLASLFVDLPPQTRRVMELRYLDGLEHDQIAAELGMERNAVDQALHRGHKKLKELLDP